MLVPEVCIPSEGRSSDMHELFNSAEKRSVPAPVQCVHVVHSESRISYPARARPMAPACFVARASLQCQAPANTLPPLSGTWYCQAHSIVSQTFLPVKSPVACHPIPCMLHIMNHQAPAPWHPPQGVDDVHRILWHASWTHNKQISASLLVHHPYTPRS